jgi:hypothetical protein
MESRPVLALRDLRRKDQLMGRRNKLPRYAKRLLAKTQQALDRGELKAGRLYVHNVYHDDWCAIYTGAGPCNCNPAIGEPTEVTREEWLDAMVEAICHPGQAPATPQA